MIRYDNTGARGKLVMTKAGIAGVALALFVAVALAACGYGEPDPVKRNHPNHVPKVPSTNATAPNGTSR